MGWACFKAWHLCLTVANSCLVASVLLLLLLCAMLQKESGNVIVFLGNESPLGIPKQPIVFENARRLNALVILVEHRYYGRGEPWTLLCTAHGTMKHIPSCSGVCMGPLI